MYDKKARRKALGMDTSGLDKKIEYAQKKIKLSGGDPNQSFTLTQDILYQTSITKV